jgi:hypothetical protein
VVKPILQQLGADPLGVKSLPTPGAMIDAPGLKAAINNLLRQQGYDGRQRWGYKGNKLALIWQLWDRHFPQAAWILVRRPVDEIVDSCLRTPFMAHHSADPAFWRDFAARRTARLDEIKRSHLSWQEIDAGTLAAGDHAGLRAIVDKLGLAWSETVYDFIDPGLWRSWRSAAVNESGPLRTRAPLGTGR